MEDTEDRLKWRTKIAVPDQLPELRATVSKQHGIQADHAAIREKCYGEDMYICIRTLKRAAIFDEPLVLYNHIFSTTTNILQLFTINYHENRTGRYFQTQQQFLQTFTVINNQIKRTCSTNSVRFVESICPDARFTPVTSAP